MLGPYKISNDKIVYVGNKVFPATKDLSLINQRDLNNRHNEIFKNAEYYKSLIDIFNSIYLGTVFFMQQENVDYFSLPVITRMISSPGAIMNTIPSDVPPFEINFFNKEAYLTQSSQLYLELALSIPRIDSLYTIEKSFRNEVSDFRHLPEFSHVEFEANIDFDTNINLQKKYQKFLIEYILENSIKSLNYFINNSDVKELEFFISKNNYEEITFLDAFKLLYKETSNNKYKTPTILNFSAKEEIQLTQIMLGESIFVCEYLSDEVAFYHSDVWRDGICFAKNADLLVCGYGELIGSGERMISSKDIEIKAERFKLNFEDYLPYIEARRNSDKTHSGWGMGIERFIQWLLKMPLISDTTCFPRLSTTLKP